MITQKSIQEILDTVKIEEVVGDFVNLKRRGVNMIGLCPFHNEKTPSFTVSPGKNICKCFGCGKGGDSVGFVMEHESLSYPEALKYLANRYNIEIEEKAVSKEYKEAQQLYDSLYLVNEYAKNYYQDQLFNTDIGKSVGLQYFKGRGFREEIVEKFGLGFAPQGKNTFTKKAIKEGYKADVLKKLGLTSKYDSDFFRNRVMFAIHNLSGKVIGFGGRILVKDVKAPKYINSPETEIYNKSKVLYGSYFAKKSIRQKDECIMVEGYTDVISLHQAGIENVVSSSGTSLTVGQIRLIKRNTPNIKIIYDGDAAGVKAALRGLDLVLEQDMNVKVVLLPDGEDPDSYLQSVGATAFTEYIDKEANDFILFKTNLLLKETDGDPVKKSAMIKDIVQSIAKIPDPLKRSLYVKECAAIVKVEEQLLINEANKLVSQAIQSRERNRFKEEAKKARIAKNTPNDPSAPDENSFPGIQNAPPTDLEAALQQQEKKSSSSSEFQEKDIIRLLITSGGQIFDPENGTTVAGFILTNIEEVLNDFDNPAYQSIAKECLEMTVANKEITQNHFITHPEREVREIAIDILNPPFEMSHNWIDIHDLPLRSQPVPEENFSADSIQAIMRFKFGKLIKVLEQSQQRIKEAQDAGDHELLDKRMKVHMKLLQVRNELAEKLKTVSLK